jgi:predicted phage tail protein
MDRRALPFITGSGGGGGKGGGGGSRAPQEAPDTLRSIQYARVINLLCEGEIEEIVGGPQGIYVDDTPLANPDGSWNFVGAAIEWRTGTPDQTPIPGFSSTESESAVGVAVTAAQPVVRSLTNPNINAVRVTLGFPQLTVTDTNTGDLNGTSVTLAIDIQYNGGGFVQMIEDTVTGKTTSRYQRSYRISLGRFVATGGTFDIRVRRITPDATTAYVVDAFQWETMTEIVEAQLNYPYSALVGVQVDASTFRQIPRLSFDVRLRRIQVPVNYDPATRAYSGLWDGTFKVAWTDNPAWVLYDLATSARFGLGHYVSPRMIDKWVLYDIAQYCDALVPNGFGGSEPRYTCNIYIQTRADAITLLQQIASIFNAMLFWSDGMLSVAADKPGDPVMQYTPANVIDGVFSYVGTPLNQRHTIALVTWNNPAIRYQQEIEYIEDRDAINQWGLRELHITALGCTSRGQAHRIGRWALLTERMLAETITFRTGIEASFARPGDVFTTTDPARAGIRAGGRLLDATVAQLVLDAPVTLQAGVTYTIAVVMPDGRIQKRDLAYTPDTTNIVTVVVPFTVAPIRMSVWSMSGSNVQNEIWRCVSVTEDESGNVDIGGVAYRADKYAAIEQDLKLEQIPTGLVDPFTIGPCTELNVTESKYQVNPVVVGARATFSWLAPLGAVRFVVVSQYEDDSPVYADVFMNSTDIQPTKAGSWIFTVYAINSIGIRSAPATIRKELLALEAPPGNVENFRLDIYNDAANLAWAPAKDMDVIVGGQVVIRFSTKLSTTVMWEEANEIARFSGAQTSGFAPLMKGTYFAKFVNASGKLSKDAALVISTTGPLRDYDLIQDIAQDPLFAGQKINMDVQYNVLYLARDVDGYAVDTMGDYYFDQLIDLGKVYTCRCQSYVEGAVYQYFNDVDTWPDWDEVADVDGTKIDEGGAVVAVSLTNVDPAVALDEDWSPWTRLVSADLTFRAARFWMRAYVNDTTQGIGIVQLGVTVNVPDRIESRNNIAVDAGGTVISFSVPFMGVPAISIIAQGLQTGDKWLIDQQSASGFRIAFQDANGTPVAKTCDWIARGYGYEHTDLDGLGYAALCQFDTPAVEANRARIGPKNVRGV